MQLGPDVEPSARNNRVGNGRPDLWAHANSQTAGDEQGQNQGTAQMPYDRSSMKVSQQERDGSHTSKAREASQEADGARGSGHRHRSKKKQRPQQASDGHGAHSVMPYLQEVPFSSLPVHQSVNFKATQEKMKSSNTRLAKAKSRENAPLSSLPMLKKAAMAHDGK